MVEAGSYDPLQPPQSADLGGSSNDSKDALGRLKWSKVPWEPPRAMGESVLRARRPPAQRSKGNQARIPEPAEESGVATPSLPVARSRRSPAWQEFSSLGHSLRPWKPVNGREGPRAGNARLPPAPCPEPGERPLNDPSPEPELAPVALLLLAVLITASGLQGQQPLVPRTR